jgi:hypothetical protein
MIDTRAPFAVEIKRGSSIKIYAEFQTGVIYEQQCLDIVIGDMNYQLKGIPTFLDKGLVDELIQDVWSVFNVLQQLNGD